jgi:hypothetical protein
LGSAIFSFYDSVWFSKTSYPSAQEDGLTTHVQIKKRLLHLMSISIDLVRATISVQKRHIGLKAKQLGYLLNYPT